MNFLTIAYCTKGAYEAEAQKLKESVDKLGMPFHLRVIDGFGSWTKNCFYKPVFIKEMLDLVKKPILYLDADAVVHSIPDIFNSMTADFAVHYYKGVQLASGTLFFNYTPFSFCLLDEWITYNLSHPQGTDQINLQHVLEQTKWQTRGRVFCLTARYCKIFDLEPCVVDPIIEHFQASRRIGGGS